MNQQLTTHCCHAPIDLVDHGDGTGSWLCSTCGKSIGGWLDKGNLDLGIIPAQIPGQLTIFQEEWTREETP